MIELGPARGCEVVLAFLRAEVDSPRYGGQIAWQLQAFCLSRTLLIDNADLDNENHNLIRLVMLDYRGFRNRAALFHQFPADVLWRRVELEPHGLGRLKYLGRDENWISFSEGTLGSAPRAIRIVNRERLEH